MRYEEHNNNPVLVVEPDDERAVVLKWLGLYSSRLQQRGPIIVVVPQHAVFRRPGDLRELQQVVAGQYDRKDMLVLVLEGNERLRLWARRQSFNVYATLETCLKASTPSGMIQDESQTQSVALVAHRLPVAAFADYTARHNQTGQDNDTRGETYRSGAVTGNSRIAPDSYLSAYFSHFRPMVGGVYSSALVARRTEPLLQRYSPATVALSLPLKPSPERTEPVTGELSMDGGYRRDARMPQVSLSSTQTSLAPGRPFIFHDEEYTWPATGIWPRSVSALRGEGRPWRRILDAWKQRASSDKSVRSGLDIVASHMQRIYQDRLLFLSVILIVFSVLGGIGFSYLEHVLSAL